MAVDLNIKRKSYGCVFVEKSKYHPVKISENLFEKVLGRGNFKIEERINDLIEQDPWLRENLSGEENIFSFSKNKYYPVHVKGYKQDSDGHGCRSINYRYCNNDQIDRLRQHSR